jgi:hypothetical protein
LTSSAARLTVLVRHRRHLARREGRRVISRTCAASARVRGRGEMELTRAALGVLLVCGVRLSWTSARRLRASSPARLTGEIASAFPCPAIEVARERERPNVLFLGDGEAPPFEVAASPANEALRGEGSAQRRSSEPRKRGECGMPPRPWPCVSSPVTTSSSSRSILVRRRRCSRLGWGVCGSDPAPCAGSGVLQTSWSFGA